VLTKHLLPGSLREWVRHKLRGAGFDVVPFPRMQMLARHGVTVLFDVGASEGLYAEDLRRLGYAGRIVSFEPRADAFARLARRAQGDPRWETVQLALGREATTSVIHLSGAADSSSLLDMLPRHTDVAPGSRYVGEQTVEVRTLDEVFDAHVGPRDVAFLKMDVQGYERHVLDGAERSLERVVGLQLELSLAPLYDGETLSAEMIALLDAKGFSLVGLEPGLRHPRTGQLLQADGLFFRTA
jgi:FkbM family methyltransferase